MYKYLLAAYAAFFTSIAHAEDHFLYYRFNDKVIITISNIECPIKAVRTENPYAVVASRIDGQFLFGCYTHRGDTIVIQWAKGDKTELPANVFLTEKPSNVPTPNI